VEALATLIAGSWEEQQAALNTAYPTPTGVSTATAFVTLLLMIKYDWMLVLSNLENNASPELMGHTDCISIKSRSLS
jgi:hypothetical protein